MSIADNWKNRVNPQTLRDVGDKATRLASRAGEKAKVAHGKAVDVVTQKDNWDAVDRYLAQVVQVLAAQEAEIADLRHQVATLTARLDGR